MEQHNIPQQLWKEGLSIIEDALKKALNVFAGNENQSKEQMNEEFEMNALPMNESGPQMEMEEVKAGSGVNDEEKAVEEEEVEAQQNVYPPWFNTLSPKSQDTCKKVVWVGRKTRKNQKEEIKAIVEGEIAMTFGEREFRELKNVFEQNKTFTFYFNDEAYPIDIKDVYKKTKLTTLTHLIRTKHAHLPDELYCYYNKKTGKQLFSYKDLFNLPNLNEVELKIFNPNCEAAIKAVVEHGIEEEKAKQYIEEQMFKTARFIADIKVKKSDFKMNCYHVMKTYKVNMGVSCAGMFFWGIPLAKFQGKETDEQKNAIFRKIFAYAVESGGVKIEDGKINSVDISDGIQKIGSLFTENPGLFVTQLDRKAFLIALCDIVPFCEVNQFEKMLHHVFKFDGIYSMEQLHQAQLMDRLTNYLIKEKIDLENLNPCIKLDTLKEKLKNIFEQQNLNFDDEWAEKINVKYVAQAMREAITHEKNYDPEHALQYIRIECDFESLGPADVKIIKENLPFVKPMTRETTVDVTKNIQTLVAKEKNSKYPPYVSAETQKVVTVAGKFITKDENGVEIDSSTFAHFTLLLRNQREIQEKGVPLHGILMTLAAIRNREFKKGARNVLQGAIIIMMFKLMSRAFKLELVLSEFTEVAIAFYFKFLILQCFSFDDEGNDVSCFCLPEQLTKPYVGFYESCLSVTIVTGGQQQKFPIPYYEELEHLTSCNNAVFCAYGGVIEKNESCSCTTNVAYNVGYKSTN